MSKHTEVPWLLNDDGDICVCYHGKDCEHKQEDAVLFTPFAASEEQIRIATAAPDMLAVLESVAAVPTSVTVGTVVTGTSSLTVLLPVIAFRFAVLLAKIERSPSPTSCNASSVRSR